MLIADTAWLILLNGRKASWEGKGTRIWTLFLPMMLFYHWVKSAKRYQQ